MKFKKLGIYDAVAYIEPISTEKFLLKKEIKITAEKVRCNTCRKEHIIKFILPLNTEMIEDLEHLPYHCPICGFKFYVTGKKIIEIKYESELY